MNRPIIHKNRGFTLIELMVVVAILGLLAVIAIPRFTRFQTYARQGEAKANLKAWFSAQRAYQQEIGWYSESVHRVGFLPERGNLYAYYFSTYPFCITRTATDVTDYPYANCITVDGATFPRQNPMPSAISPVQLWYAGEGADPGMPGLGGCTTGIGCNLSGMAVGNLDDDYMENDTWWISTKDATSIHAACGNDVTQNVAGEPYLSYNDIDCDIY